jgi:hypothetical protein
MVNNICEKCYRASPDFKRLVELTDTIHTKHPSLDVVEHFLFDINSDLTDRGVRGWESSSAYLNRRIEQLQSRIGMFQDKKAVDYISEVITLMENIKNAGINLPSHESPVW